ncbi:MAG: uroporphyrinogen decarboxylase family protein [Peptococcaceae bacterium]|jgi:uroporphyrinogen decarboxylase|nr:uroporphyrinogen decarboxylase family protein [Peptococcaceae bacterium]
MNHAELIERVARLQPVERAPFALLSSGAWAIIRKGSGLENALSLDPAVVADWLYEGYTSAGSAISWVGSGYNNIVVKAVGGKIKWRRKGTPDVVEPLLSSVDDIAAFDPAVIADDPDIRAIYEIAGRLVEREQGQRLVGGSMWGPFTLAGLLFGADALMRLIIKDTVALDKLLRFSAELYLAYMQGYIDRGVRVIFMAEPSASGDMISRRHFEQAALPYIREIYRRLSGKGLILGLHICGDSGNRLDLIAESGAQIMSLDYKVPLELAKRAFAGKIAFSGNLDPVSVVQQGTEEEIRKLTIQSIETVGTDSGYIVMPGCDIPPSTPLENLQIISRTVNEYTV